MRMKYNNLFHLVVIFIVTLSYLPPNTHAQFPDFLFACPAWGCSARGTFSWPTPPPRSSPTVAWNWTEDGITYGKSDFLSRGCSSSLTTVSCPTSTGLVSLVAATGKENWVNKSAHYSLTSDPFLPVVDYYGNILQADQEKLVYVTGRDRLPQDPVNLTAVKPVYGPAVTYAQTVLMTSSHVGRSQPQVVTYSKFGDVLASTSLRDDRLNATFLPNGHPIIDFERAYVVAVCISDLPPPGPSPSSYGPQRLYAIDLSGNQTDNKIAWYVDLPQPRTGNFSSRDYPNDNAVLAFYNKTVFVSYPGPNNNQVLMGFKDLGDSAKRLFEVFAPAGPMAIYDVEGSPLYNITATGPRPLWVAKRLGRSLTAFDRDTGKTLTTFSVDEVEGVKKPLGYITSYIQVTRLAEFPDRDVLVFATSDEDGQAYVVAVLTAGLPSSSTVGSTGLPPLAKPRLLWSVNVSGGRRAPGRVSQWTVGGQIASVAVVKEEKLVGFGLVVNVVEHLMWVDANQVYVRMIM